MEGALLRIDPEQLASNAALMRYALPRGAHSAPIAHNVMVYLAAAIPVWGCPI